MARHARGGALRIRAHLPIALVLVAIAGCGGGSGGSGASAATIGGTPLTQAQVGQTYSFTPTAADSGRGAVSFSIANKPPWANFSIATGQLTGTPTAADIGTYANIVIRISDGTAKASLAPFTITVSPGGTESVTLSWVVPTTNTNGSPITELTGYTISYGPSATDLSQSVSITSPSTTSYTVGNLTAGTWYFAIAADAINGVESTLSNVVSTTLP